MGSGICSSFHTVIHPSKLCSKQLHQLEIMGQRKILFKQAKHWEGHSHSCLKALHATLTAKARHVELRSHTAKVAWCQNGITIHSYCPCPWEAEPWAGQCEAALRSLSQGAQEGANPPWLMSPGTPPSPAAASTPRKPTQHFLL